jgi:hypothetical protein
VELFSAIPLLVTVFDAFLPDTGSSLHRRLVAALQIAVALPARRLPLVTREQPLRFSPLAYLMRPKNKMATRSPRLIRIRIHL